MLLAALDLDKTNTLYLFILFLLQSPRIELTCAPDVNTEKCFSILAADSHTLMGTHPPPQKKPHNQPHINQMLLS
jgi:hypothetical protein